MAEEKKTEKGNTKGEMLTVPDPAVVVPPNGQPVRVVGGRYVVETDGRHKVSKA